MLSENAQTRSASPSTHKSEFGPLGSKLVTECQVCASTDLGSVLFLGYLPPVNTMPNSHVRPNEQPAYPAELLTCRQCGLFQLGLIVKADILFPPSYPYTSGTTKILRENFAELYQEVMNLYPLETKDVVIDIGSNDGTLLSNFTAHRVLGIEPTNAGKLANERGIRTHISFFNDDATRTALKEMGQAQLITATNVFAHIDGVHNVVKNIGRLLGPKGIFVNESHYFPSLVRTVQYDTVYHEHMRYYSLQALNYLLEKNGMEIIHAKEIPTHGGSIRVYSARKGTYPVNASVAKLMQEEKKLLSPESLEAFKKKVVQSKVQLHSLFKDIKAKNGRIFGVGAPSRASTLINYVGIDAGLMDCVTEIKGSYKIGKNIPGTLVPVVEESALFDKQPDYALLLSWHIAEELIPKLTEKGFRGDFIVPLPEPHIVKNSQRK